MEEEKFFKLLQDERDKIVSLRFDMNKDIGERQIMNINQRREFFQQITILSLGFASITFLADQIKHETYFYLGIIFLITVVLLISSLLRETFDHESRSLKTLQDKYNAIIEEKYELINEFSNEKFTDNSIREYFSRISALSGVSILDEDLKHEKEERKNISQQSLDYSGELIIFIFF